MHIPSLDLAAMGAALMEGHFVRTTMEEGLTDAGAHKALDILMIRMQQQQRQRQQQQWMRGSLTLAPARRSRS